GVQTCALPISASAQKFGPGYCLTTIIFYPYSTISDFCKDFSKSLFFTPPTAHLFDFTTAYDCGLQRQNGIGFSESAGGTYGQRPASDTNHATQYPADNVPRSREAPGLLRFRRRRVRLPRRACPGWGVV